MLSYRIMEKNISFTANDINDLQYRIAEYEDAAAYKKLFFLFFLPLKSFSFSIIKSKEIAEEIVSDVFMQIWAKRKELIKIENLKMYLYVSVRNNSLRKLHHDKKITTVSLDDLHVDFASVDPNAEAFLITNELSKKIDDAITHLPTQCKMVFKMAKEDNLRYKEIAQLLNISVKTIDNHIAAALKKIASALNAPTKKHFSN